MKTVQTSRMLLRSEKAPMVEKKMIAGPRIANGMRSRLTIMRVSISPSTRIAMLAQNMPQNRIQTSGLCWIMTRGPGVRSCRVSTPIMIAVKPPPGSPSASSGTMAPPVAELFAVSAATMPSGSPVPKRSGCFDQRTASL